MNAIEFSLKPTHQAFKITSIRLENERTRTLILDRPLDCNPGQFIMLWLPGIGEKPFSIAGNNPLTLTIVDVGDFSHAIASLKEDDKIWLRGPLGQGYAPLGHRLLLVGGGYGAAPLSFLAREALAKGHTVDVCLGARRAQDIILADEFRGMMANVFLSTDDGSTGKKGLVTQITETCIQANPPDAIYACGPVKMLEAVETLGNRYHIPCQLSWEAFMRCGMGLCGSCELEINQDETDPRPHHRPGWLVCLDGPVSFTTPPELE